MHNEGGDPAEVRALILEVVDNQVRENTPPQTRSTLNRLRKDGLAEAEARHLIAGVVACEIFAMLKHGERFDQGRFVSRLEQLPDMSWMEEGAEADEEESEP